ncbi:hypothetical protein WJX73_006829 [Symbiochloris irregularis]|uniref:HMG box domain-containing protein n=1 Tax=Symbiochloris irregularis TaxID=706552 RepID=A0AAW1NS93_9CHLO
MSEALLGNDTPFLGQLKRDASALSAPPDRTADGAGTSAAAPEQRKRTRTTKSDTGAPRRPKSAYLWFMAEYREQWKKDHPDRQKVAEIAQACGEAWRALAPEQKAIYEELSTADKADYAISRDEYLKANPKPARKTPQPQGPKEPKRPQSAYMYFLSAFRAKFKREQQEDPASCKAVGQAAGEHWRHLTPAEKAPYEDMAAASKAEYARLASMKPMQRVMTAAAAAMQDPGSGPAQPADLRRNGAIPGGTAQQALPAYTPKFINTGNGRAALNLPPPMGQPIQLSIDALTSLESSMMPASGPDPALSTLRTLTSREPPSTAPGGAGPHPYQPAPQGQQTTLASMLAPVSQRLQGRASISFSAPQSPPTALPVAPPGAPHSAAPSVPALGTGDFFRCLFTRNCAPDSSTSTALPATGASAVSATAPVQPEPMLSAPPVADMPRSENGSQAAPSGLQKFLPPALRHMPALRAQTMVQQARQG